MTQIKFLITVLILILCAHTGFSQSLFNDRDEGHKVFEKYKNRPQAAFSKLMGKSDRAVGIMDRGELANVTGNFGILSNFHLFSPALHWPSWADDTHQYCFGLELMVGYRGDVVTSVHDPASVAENFDWEALDGSYGNLYSGNVTASDGTPLMAGSDNRNTWPTNENDKPFWPGPFRYNPDTGGEKEGEFISERDIYGEFTDQNNQKGSYGLKVKQRAFSFSRSYARNFIIFDFQIINTSQQLLDSVWIGYMADFKVDFDTHDHIRFVSLDPSQPDNKNLVYLRDADPSKGIWDITGYIGMLSLFTPGNQGITDFHFFDNIYEPGTNGQLWEIMTSDTIGSNITPGLYFHGDNHRIDDDALADDMDPSGQKLGTDFVFIISTGPVSIASGDSVRSAFAVVMGETKEQMMANAEMVRDMSLQNYLGPNAPPSPEVQAFSSEGKVTLTWDGSAAETAQDLLSGKMDFEGYRVYRSDDFGLSWGNPITDERGNLIGFVPLAQYDLDNTVSGKDPNSNFYLGNNSGLKHTFTDSSVINGKEYWYSVTSYDRGDVTTGLPALESSRGVSPDEPNVVQIVPMGTATNLNVFPVEHSDSLPPLEGPCDSRLSLQILDPALLTGHSYRITFNDVGRVIRATTETAAETLFTTTFNLIDLTSQDTLLRNHPLLDESGDNSPAVDGFRILARDARPAVTFLGWTKVNGDTCTYAWQVTNFDTFATHPWREPPAIYSGDDYKITVDYNVSGGSMIRWYDVFTGQDQDTSIHVPIRIEKITDPENPMEIGAQSWLGDYEIHSDPAWHNSHYSPLGWDLEPGGAGYNPNYPWQYIWPDVLLLERKLTDPENNWARYVGIKLFTQNFPSDFYSQGGFPKHIPAVQPSQGDEFVIRTRKLFRSDIYFEFQTNPPEVDARVVDLSRVKVVPNPYIVKAGWERSEFEGRLQFTNLPGECEISIYSTAGDHIDTIYHSGFTDSAYWNLRNNSEVNIAYGLYVYVIKTPGGEKNTGRFVIIR